MLEKDIENLLANHPSEFMTEEVKLEGQQVRLGTNFVDILFKYPHGGLLVVEVKRGILGRDAIGQIIEYYGTMRRLYPNKNTRIMLVANVIPRDLTTFLMEKLDTKFLEIPASKLRDVARKYGYLFLDRERPDQVMILVTTIKELSQTVSEGHKVWMFQANPDRYDILNALANERIVDDVWSVNQHSKDIHSGDVCLIWMSGVDSGIYALGRVTSDPEMLGESSVSGQYWVSDVDRGQPRLRVKFRNVLKLYNNPIMRDRIKSTPGLEDLSILKNPRGTNFPVTLKQWNAILELIQK